MKKIYEKPEIQLISLDYVDLLTLSISSHDASKDEEDVYVEFADIFT